MNVHTDHSNLLPKPMFHNFKNQDYLPNKLKPLASDINHSEAHHHSKENALKLNNIKHEFKTPAIVHTHKLPKAFNNNFSNSKLEHEKIHDEMKVLDNNQDTKNKFEEIDVKKNIFIIEKKGPTGLKILQKPSKNELKLDKIEQKSFKLNKNPIIPLKNFFKIAKQNENDFFFESPTVKLMESRCNKLEIKKFPNEEKLQMNEMVTVSIINPSDNNNQIKMMLHVPTLKTYAIREESLINVENFHLRKRFLTNWQTNLNFSENFLHIYELFWNYPEGYTSMLCDIMRGGSLKDLLEYGGCMNETMMKSLAEFLLKAYREFYSKTKTSLGVLSLSQILFDEQGGIKIGPKLAKSTLVHKMSDFNHWRIPFSKFKQNSEISNNEELFEIGIVLLYCAIGNIELFDITTGSGDIQKNFNNDEIKESMFLKSDTNFFLKDRKKELKTLENDLEIEIGSSCCLLHLLYEFCEEKKLGDFLKKRHDSHFLKTFSRKNGILMKNILEKKFSHEFIDFLCSCLGFDQKNQQSFEDLLAHAFFTSKNQSKNDVCLNEIANISSNWNLNRSNYAIKDKVGHIIQSICIVLEEKNIQRMKFFEKNNLEKLSCELSCCLGMSPSTIIDVIKSIQVNNNT